MRNESTTKTNLLSAFDKAERKTVGEICRIAGVTPGTFYFHYYKDNEFRRQILEKRRDLLNQKIFTA